MTEIDERLNALLDHRMCRATGDPSHKRHTARVVFDGGVRSLTCLGDRIKLRIGGPLVC